MNVYTINVDPQKINLHPESILEEIFQNVNTIVTTIAGEVPLLRSFGIKDEYIDLPAQVVRTKLIAEIKEKVEEYEPRARVIEVNYRADLMDGVVWPSIKIGIDEEVEV